MPLSICACVSVYIPVGHLQLARSLLCCDYIRGASLTHLISSNVRLFGRPLASVCDPLHFVRLSVRRHGRLVCCAVASPPRQYFYFQEVLAAKQCIMQANAELHQSFLAKQKKRFGEEISRLQVRCRLHLHFSSASFLRTHPVLRFFHF